MGQVCRKDEGLKLTQLNWISSYCQHHILFWGPGITSQDIRYSPLIERLQNKHASTSSAMQGLIEQNLRE